MVYEELREAWKRERESATLQKLPEDFYEKVGIYTRRLNETIKSLDRRSLRARLLLEELKRVRFLLTRLLELRHGKLLKGAKVAPSDLCKSEVELFKLLKWKRDLEGLVDKILGGEGISKVLVRFLRPAPSFVGVDLKKYGPFKVGDVAYLPRKNVNILVKEGVGVEVEVK